MGVLIIRCIVCLGLASVSVASAWASDCKEIDRYLEWRGGDKFRSLQTVQMSGEVSGYGRTGEASLILRRDGYSLQEFQLNPFSVIRGLTPETAWGKLPFKQAGHIGLREYNESVRTIDQVLSLSLQQQGDGEVSCLSTERRDGKLYKVIRVAYPDRNYFDLYVSPRTGALGWIRQREGGELSWTKLHYWRTVDGVRMPYRWTLSSGKQEQRIHWNRIALNRALPTSQFACPTDLGKFCRFREGDTGSGWIDFEFYAQKHIMLEATINGVRRKVLLDSASVTTVIDEEFARELGLSGKKGFKVKGTSGEADAAFTTDLSIEIGNVELTNHPVAIIDLSEINAPPLSVILGAEVFNELVVDIDYPNERLAFYEPESFTGESLADPIQVYSGGGGARQVLVSLNGDKTALVSLDTGLSFGMLMFKDWTDANIELGDMDTQLVNAIGIGGTDSHLRGIVDTVTVGDKVLEDVPVNFARSSKGSTDSVHVAGLIGTQIFRKFRTTFDLTRNLLYLTPPD